MIRISFNGSDERLVAALHARGPKLVAAERATLNELMGELQEVVHRKLSGEVLQSRGGGLLKSLRVKPITQEGAVLTGIVQAGGDKVWWAKVHEWGGNMAYEIWPVKKKALAFFPGGSAGAVVQSGVFASQGFGQTAMTKLMTRRGPNRGSVRPGKIGMFRKAGGVVVRFVVHPPLPRRPFMGPALREMQGRIVERVFATAAEALR